MPRSRIKSKKNTRSKYSKRSRYSKRLKRLKKVNRTKNKKRRMSGGSTQEVITSLTQTFNSWITEQGKPQPSPNIKGFIERLESTFQSTLTVDYKNYSMSSPGKVYISYFTLKRVDRVAGVAAQAYDAGNFNIRIEFKPSGVSPHRINESENYLDIVYKPTVVYPHTTFQDKIELTLALQGIHQPELISITRGGDVFWPLQETSSPTDKGSPGKKVSPATTTDPPATIVTAGNIDELYPHGDETQWGKCSCSELKKANVSLSALKEYVKGRFIPASTSSSSQVEPVRSWHTA
tara:strand:- start:1540 stop:2415 length:876 start_codon:yes stop_codon:yes gene_type:complete